MFPYKVIFIESSYDPKKTKSNVLGYIDGYLTSNEIEALLVEQHNIGYTLVQIVPINGNVTGKIGYPNQVTIGFMVTFKKV